MGIFDKVKDIDDDNLFEEKLDRVELRKQNLDFQDSTWHAKNILFSGEIDENSGIQMYDFNTGEFSKEFKDYKKNKGEILKSVGGNPRDLHYSTLNMKNTRKLGNLAEDPMEGGLLGHDLATYTKGDWKKSTDPAAMMMNLDRTGKMITVDGEPLSPYFIISMAQDNMDEIFAEKGYEFGNIRTEPNFFEIENVAKRVTKNLRNYILSENSKFKVVDKPKPPKK